jgi:16S rRNA (cytosine1402-N4)-methyltransferase
MGGTKRSRESEASGAPQPPASHGPSWVRRREKQHPVSTQFDHRSVLLEKSVSLLELKSNSLVIDGTVGGGGHAAEILERSGPHGRVIGLDRDPEALAAARIRLTAFGDRVRLVQSSFTEISEVLAELGETQVDGVLLDLGVSSPQIDDPNRGFRFASDTADQTPLDMRMDPDSGPTAAELLRSTVPDEMARWFHEYGDVRGSRRLAAAIVAARKVAPLRTSADLLRVIAEAGVGGGRKHNPATLVFQALRIAVNDEIGALAAGVEAGIEALSPGGRIVVIAYHSVEDRLVKNAFRDAQRGCTCPPRTPMCICGNHVRLNVITRRPLSADPDEIRANPRARSARLRVAERVPEAA